MSNKVNSTQAIISLIKNFSRAVRNGVPIDEIDLALYRLNDEQKFKNAAPTRQKIAKQVLEALYKDPQYVGFVAPIIKSINDRRRGINEHHQKQFKDNPEFVDRIEMPMLTKKDIVQISLYGKDSFTIISDAHDFLTELNEEGKDRENHARFQVIPDLIEKHKRDVLAKHPELAPYERPNGCVYDEDVGYFAGGSAPTNAAPMPV